MQNKQSTKIITINNSMSTCDFYNLNSRPRPYCYYLLGKARNLDRSIFIKNNRGLHIKLVINFSFFYFCCLFVCVLCPK